MRIKPRTKIYEIWICMNNLDSMVVEYILKLINQLIKCQELIVEKMIENQEKRKLWYDQYAVTEKFEMGDLVLILITSKFHKMSVNWMVSGNVKSVICSTNHTIFLGDKIIQPYET